VDLTRIRNFQESAIIELIADGLSPVEWDALEKLVTDGGQVALADIAEYGGVHLDSVYDALDRLDDMVSREYGSVSLRSHHVAELVHQAVEAFVAWAASHGFNWRGGATS
jgi:hypothetical protein